MDQKKIGSFLKELRNEKISLRNSWRKTSMYRAGPYHVGKQDEICRTSRSL